MADHTIDSNRAHRARPTTQDTASSPPASTGRSAPSGGGVNDPMVQGAADGRSASPVPTRNPAATRSQGAEQGGKAGGSGGLLSKIRGLVAKLTGGGGSSGGASTQSTDKAAKPHGLRGLLAGLRDRAEGTPSANSPSSTKSSPST